MRIREIQLAVCDVFGVSLDDLLSHRRDDVVPRQVAVWLSRIATGRTNATIAKAFNRHPTAIHLTCAAAPERLRDKAVMAKALTVLLVAQHRTAQLYSAQRSVFSS